MFDPTDPGPDYTLAWPRAVFVSEARLLLTPGETSRTDWPEKVAWLLTEAFVSDMPRDDFWTATQFSVGIDPWASRLENLAMAAQPPQRTFFTHLLSATAAGRLPEQTTPRPYYPARHGSTSRPAKPADRSSDLRRDWRLLLADLTHHGYLDRLAPRACVDDDAPAQDLAVALSNAFADRLGVRDMWPLPQGDLDDDSFYGMIEVIHDLVARPRPRTWHDFNQCGWHYSGFAIAPAQRLYRWRVNQLLDRNGVGLHLAGSGEDAGRLVRTAGDDRDRLTERALATEGTDHDTVEHALALFRSRTATRETKRSAVVALARVLEERRSLLKAQQLGKDEGALFQIANQFDLRHRNGRQHQDYAEEFLDWIFWWYLATVELTNRLLARDTPTAS